MKTSSTKEHFPFVNNEFWQAIDLKGVCAHTVVWSVCVRMSAHKCPQTFFSLLAVNKYFHLFCFKK